MPAHPLMKALKLFAACPLVLAVATGSRAEQPPAAPKNGAAVTTRQAANPRVTVGAYYFDGWAGRSERWKDDATWAALNPPTHLTKRMLDEFADREPIWGWRDDSLTIMERQIDLAADHGIAFFAICWYWNADPQKVAQDPKHTGLQLFLKAKNNHRLKFCLLVANHAGFVFRDADEWQKAAEGWLPYLKLPQHLTVDGKPLVIIFNPSNGDQDGFARVQDIAHRAGLPGYVCRERHSLQRLAGSWLGKFSQECRALDFDVVEYLDRLKIGRDSDASGQTAADKPSRN